VAKSLRLSEKWFRRGLWLVALVFAGFLIGLGGQLVDDLPKVEKPLQVDDFLDRAGAERLRESIKRSQRANADAQSALEQARLKLQAARADTQSTRQTFNNWLATRRATQMADQDPEVIARTRALDALAQAERAAQSAVEKQEQAALDSRQAEAKTRQLLQEMEDEAHKAMQQEARRVELRVFLYRLALTLPLLAVAGLLYRKHRHSTWWPFVWGFIFFALFAFFVELVPYLPSYGGYVRYIVGIVITALVGRQAIIGLNRYLERQKLAEQMPEVQRRDSMSYDEALAKLAKGVCPGCERPVQVASEKIDFCPHCGIGLHDHCGACDTRKSAFSKFCHACGASGGPGLTRLVAGPA
jgi:hypothetical protein